MCWLKPACWCSRVQLRWLHAAAWVCCRVQPTGHYDVVFSNWLLMYLSDQEVQALAAKVLNWVSQQRLTMSQR